MVVRRTTRRRLLRWQQWRDARPPCLGQGESGVAEDLDRQRALRSGLLPRPTRRVAAPGDRLVPAPKGRPGEAEAAALRRLREGQQQAAHFRHGEGDQVGGTPFCPAVAWSRVTSR